MDALLVSLYSLPVAMISSAARRLLCRTIVDCVGGIVEMSLYLNEK